jgi:hypothetical protein
VTIQIDAWEHRLLAQAYALWKIDCCMKCKRLAITFTAATLMNIAQPSPRHTAAPFLLLPV